MLFYFSGNFDIDSPLLRPKIVGGGLYYAKQGKLFDLCYFEKVEVAK